MSCTNPQPYLIKKNGGRPQRLQVDWEAGQHLLGRVVYLPCGGCLACRRERRQELTLLQCCEASLHDDNWFVTLTYDDWKTIQLDGLPPYSLNKKHLSEFNESMRKYCQYNGVPYRFFACGEYGDQNERPHYHLTIFGLSPKLLGIKEGISQNDRTEYLARFAKIKNFAESSRDSSGFMYWQSPVISSRWQYGNHQIYRANRETMQYVAGYTVKKLTGDLGKAFRATGRVSEFATQSRPSIGFPWFTKFFETLSQPDGDKLVNDYLSIAGVSWRIPRIFKKWYSLLDPFNAPAHLDMLQKIRELDLPLVPDRQDLKRKADFDLYSAERYKSNRSLHKEVN